MVNKTDLIDWAEVCSLSDFMIASYENKIYAVGGNIQLTAGDQLFMASMLNTQGTSESLAEPFNLDYIFVMDFSKPVNSSQNSIDISTDNITTAIRLSSAHIHDGATFISDGVMHLLPEGVDFHLTTQGMTSLGLEYVVNWAAIAFDPEKQVGWYYGGVEPNDGSFSYSQDLIRINRGRGTPIKVDVDSSSVGTVLGGELVYLKNVGEAGVLVLIGGAIYQGDTQMRPMDTVHVFDIATNTWFTQRTTAEERYPRDRTSMCSVVASAEDSSSHNIYIYGGINGTVINEIHVLTLPAFHWILVYPSYCVNGTCDTRRVYSHECQKVYEKHMVAYRGKSFNNYCDNDKRVGKFQGMRIYDMSSLEWTAKVELENQKYLVPRALYEIIGGDAMGNATITAPRGGFQDPKLEEVFTGQVVNKTTPITILPPTTISPPSTILPPIAGPRGDKHTQGRLPVGAIAGAIVVFVLFIAAAFLLRRRQQRMVEIPEMTASIELQEMQDCGIQELHDPKHVPELPTLPIELYGSIPKIELDS